MAPNEKAEPPSIDVEAAPEQTTNTELWLEKTVSRTDRSVHSNLTQHQSIISRTLSRVRTSDSIPTTPPPDGGFQAWSMAGLALLVNFNTWGFVNSFGAFQTYYVDVMQLGPNSAVSWIGSLLVFFVFGIGILSGRAFDAGYFRLLFWSGSLLSIFGFFMLSLCKTYYQVFLAHAVCIGIGLGIAFSPSTTLASTYFSHAKRSVALAVVVSGASVGGLIYPTIANQLLPKIGFGWTIRTMAFLQLAIFILCGTCMKPRLPPRKSGPMVEWVALKEPAYALFLSSAYFFFWGVYIGFFYIGIFARDTLGTSQKTSINLLLVLNGTGIVARLLPNIVAQKWTGPFNLLIVYLVANAVVLLSWIAVKSVAALWVWAVVYGCTAAGIHALFPVCLTSLTDDPKKFGARNGMGFFTVGVAVLTGPPIAGALIDRAGGSYVGLQCFAAGTMIISGFFALGARWAQVRWKLMVKI